MICLAGILLLLPQTPGFVVENRASTEREELVRVSLPLPRGRFRDLAFVTVDGGRAPTTPLVTWADGSLALVQIHARIRLAAGERRRFAVGLQPDTSRGVPETPEAARAPAAAGPARSSAWHLQGELPLHTELRDPWNQLYTARLREDPTAGRGGLLVATPALRVRRYRATHRRAAAAFLGLVAYLTTFAGERRAELTLVLDNAAHGSAPVLGPVRLGEFTLVVEDEQLRSRPRFIRENQLRPPRLVDGRWRQTLLGPSDQLYLGDRTAKAWRFDLFLDGEGVSRAERRAARLVVSHPLTALPDLEWTRHTRAFGAHGGPAPGPGTATPETLWMLGEWRRRAVFGPFGGFGDPRDAALNGTPRNGPSALHNVLRFGSGALLHSAEGMVLQHCLRPSPGQPVRLPAATAALRQGLSKRTMQQPHGFTALDYEHFSVDLLYDYFWLTGDPLARDEMRRAGRGLPGLLSGLPYQTCRGEGWCMQAAVLIRRATGAASPLREVEARYREVVEPALGRDPAPYIIRQPPHPRVLGGQEAFDCPWQMAAFVHGLHAMHRQTGDPRYARAAVRTGRVMAGPGWLEGEGPKYLLSAAEPGRYMLPVGFGPVEGTALMQVGAFVLAQEMARGEVDKQLFWRRAEFIFAPYEKAERDRTAMNPWFQLLLDRRARRR